MKTEKDIKFHGSLGESTYEFMGEQYRRNSDAVAAMNDYNEQFKKGVREYKVSYQITIFEERSVVVKATSKEEADDKAYTKLHDDASISEIDVDTVRIDVDTVGIEELK